jgi:hypothetical protein
MFPSKYLAKEDAPSPIQAVISEVKMAELEFDGEIQSRVLCTFTDHRLKPMILNRTVVAVLSAAYGDDTLHWGGQPVIIYSDPTVMYMGKMVGGLRLRVPDPVPTPGPAAESAKMAVGPKKGGGK